jgi:hypothetical protein
MIVKVKLFFLTATTKMNEKTHLICNFERPQRHRHVIVAALEGSSVRVSILQLRHHPVQLLIGVVLRMVLVLVDAEIVSAGPVQLVVLHQADVVVESAFGGHLDLVGVALVTQRFDREIVLAWQQDPVVVAVLVRLDVVRHPLDDHFGPHDGPPDRAPDEPVDPSVDLLRVREQSVSVVQPVLGQALRVGVLVTADLEGELHATGHQVVPVLHPPAHRVPLGPVRDAPLETLLGEQGARLALVHRLVRLEQIVFITKTTN